MIVTISYLSSLLCGSLITLAMIPANAYAHDRHDSHTAKVLTSKDNGPIVPPAKKVLIGKDDAPIVPPAIRA